MTQHDASASDKRSGGSRSTKTADDVRRIFADLPLDSKVSTLIRLELDLMGDVADRIVSAASRVVDDLSKGFEACGEAAFAEGKKE